MTITESKVAGNHKKKSDDETGPAPAVPGLLDTGGDDEDPEYDKHLRVTLAFYERLENCVKEVNRPRVRSGKRKRAIGWFVIKHMERWILEVEAALGIQPPPPPE